MAWPGAYFEPPSPADLRWVEASVGAGSRVVRVRRLGGGTVSAMHAVDVSSASGTALRLVLRRHVRSDIVLGEPDIAAREATILGMLARIEFPGPRLVAVDADAQSCDCPAVLMTRLPGRLDLRPIDVDRWLSKLAALLIQIHAIDPGDTPIPPWVIWDDLRGSDPPVWSSTPRVWELLVERVSGPWPSHSPTFLHRDFQYYNVLWSRGRPTAVDWHNASMGPADVDVAHLRRNLVGDFGLDVAERFLATYQDFAGTEVDPFWEALSLKPLRDPTPREADAFDRLAASLLSRLA